MNRVNAKSAIVTGGASGIGAGIARRLLAEGAKVTITDIQRTAGETVAGELGCSFICQDVTEARSWEAVLAEVEARQGGLHILVNNAGIEGAFSDPETTKLEDWQVIQRVNVEGVFLGCRAAIPAIRRAGGGSIVNVSSAAGFVAVPYAVAYAASKAAVRNLTMSVALHCARNRSRVRCNSVHPGVIHTPMIERIITELARQRGVPSDTVLREFMAEIPQGEFQDADDVANAVLFLASDEARHVTGTAMVVDGGSLLGVA